MEKSKTIKAMTLLSFATLLISFVAFKAGTFDRHYTEGSERTQSPIGEQAIKSEAMPSDTPIVKKPDTLKVNPAMLSTSKSAILIDQKIEFLLNDSLKKDSIRLAPKK